MDTISLSKSTLLGLLLCFLGGITAQAQKSPIPVAEILAGDDILFLEGLETANRSVIDTTADRIFYQYLDEEGEVRDSSIERHLVVKAYKNIQGRRRLDTFQKGTKVRWKQHGKRKYGFVELYSGAKENLDIMYYSDTLIDIVQIPVQYVSPIYGETDHADTLRMLNQIWEADESLFMFPIEDSIEYCYPLMENITLTPTFREKNVQFIFTNLKFAMLMKDDLKTGIVGKWQVNGDEIHITTAVASLPADEVGNKKRLRCSDTYVYNWRLEDEGKRLLLSHVGPLLYVPEIPEVMEPEPEIEIENPVESNPSSTRVSTTREMDKPRTSVGVGIDRPQINKRPQRTSTPTRKKLHPFWRDKY